MSGFVYDGVRWLRADRIATITDKAVHEGRRAERFVTMIGSNQELTSDGTAAELLQRLEDLERVAEGIDFDAPSWTPPAAPAGD